jgi:hypothetical protein
MTTPLTTRSVRRLFAFGCSFTRWLWTGWPELVANHLNIPHWNFGRSGAGNQFIFTRLMQAKRYYNIGPDDLVIICWSHLSREDRWDEQIKDWRLVGNVYFAKEVWDQNWILRWGNSTHYALRDLSLISAAKDVLDQSGCQYHFFSICDPVDNIDEYFGHAVPKQERDTLLNLYQQDLASILPSYYRSLWNNDPATNKFKFEAQYVHPMFFDGHPRPIEHYKYLGQFWPEILVSQAVPVMQAEKTFQNYFKSIYSDTQRVQGDPGTQFTLNILTEQEQEEIIKLTTIRPSEEFTGNIL